jgi:dihydrodipicolinate synthase/N-acetylneuraminate lyase
MPDNPQLPSALFEALHAGLVIPAHPLALDHQRRFDERHQRALTRYYLAAGAGGIAVGVHSTQFAIRAPRFGLYRPVMELAAESARDCDRASGAHTLLVAGIAGLTGPALAEAHLAVQLGYHIGLVSLGAFREASDDTLIAHCSALAQEIPLMGFYLQSSVGGRPLSYAFWRRFVEIPNVAAIKIAPFNRYQTLDVVRAVAESGRADEIALYTGNDDHILLDLLTEYEFPGHDGPVRVPIVGGLLGHWACWTQKVPGLLEQAREARRQGLVGGRLLTLAGQVTDCNAAFFDAAHAFAGALPGVQEVLRRQGLLANHLTLDPAETLSPGQAEEIDRVCRAYPHLNDDDFVRSHLPEWLA